VATASRFLITVEQGPPGAVSPRPEIVGRDGHLIRLVAGQGSGAALSPNRKEIAWDGKGGIRVEKVDGSDARLAVRFRCLAKAKSGAKLGICGGPFVWSPDSRKLLFAEANGGLAIVSLSTGAKREIVAPAAHVGYEPIAWSGGANSILFAASGGVEGTSSCCSYKLVVARPSGTFQRTLYSAQDGVHDGPRAAWSPDGTRVAFTTDGRALGDPRCAFVEVATGRTTRVRKFNGYSAPPAWNPQSSRIAVGGYQQPVEIISSRGRKLGSIPQTSLYPTAWTRGGIYLMPGGDNRGSVLVIPNGQHAARTVFTLPEGQVLLAVQPI
jgi:hypothetical protein